MMLNMTLLRSKDPRQVFTPGELPINRGNVYVSRQTSEKLLRRGIERNWCPVVYGDYGVGKSSMVRHYFRSEQKSSRFNTLTRRYPKRGRLVYFASSEGLTMPKVFQVILEHLDYRVETEVLTSENGSFGFNAGDKINSISATLNRGSQKRQSLVVSTPTDEKMLDIINSSKLTIIIDELHNSSDTFRTELVRFIRASRISAHQANLVLIGTSADAQELVKSDPGLDRYLTDTPVEKMKPEESTELIRSGFRKLKIEIGESLVNRVVQVASGAPYILQSLCLDIAQTVRRNRRNNVQETDFTEAVKQFIRDRSGRMAKSYISAIETQGKKRYRKQILHAIAQADSDYATMDDIRTYVSSKLGEQVAATALSGPLRDLKQQNFDNILRNVERETGDSIQNVSSFTDPMMKSYIRFMISISETEVVTEDELRLAAS